MIVIGLTGGSGTGKSEASGRFADLGAEVIDADQIYRELCETSEDMLQGIEEHFPGTVTDGALDRKALAVAAFSDPAKMATLNGLTHPYILDVIIRRLQKYRGQGTEIAVIDAALLFEAHGDRLCDVVIGVVADDDIRVGRIVKRDGITPEQARSRIAAQKPVGFYFMHCNLIIQNNESLDALKARVDHLFGRIRKGDFSRGRQGTHV